MQDRFRFRVFDKELNVLIKPEDINHINFNAPHGIWVRTDNFQSNNMGYIGEKFELMQCTGLKDSEGKLIYEGDIIEIINTCFFNKTENCLVRFCEQDCCFLIDTTYGTALLKNYPMKIIGNKFENSTLLKGG